MKERVTHDLAPWLASGWKDTCQRIPFPRHAAIMAACRAINADPAHARSLRIAVEPDSWAVILDPAYAGEPYTESPMLP